MVAQCGRPGDRVGDTHQRGAHLRGRHREGRGGVHRVRHRSLQGGGTRQGVASDEPAGASHGHDLHPRGQRQHRREVPHRRDHGVHQAPGHPHRPRNCGRQGVRQGVLVVAVAAGARHSLDGGEVCREQLPDHSTGGFRLFHHRPADIGYEPLPVEHGGDDLYRRHHERHRQARNRRARRQRRGRRVRGKGGKLLPRLGAGHGGHHLHGRMDYRCFVPGGHHQRGEALPVELREGHVFQGEPHTDRAACDREVEQGRQGRPEYIPARDAAEPQCEPCA